MTKLNLIFKLFRMQKKYIELVGIEAQQRTYVSALEKTNQALRHETHRLGDIIQGRNPRTTMTPDQAKKLLAVKGK